MASYRTNFEKELRGKLLQKSTSHQSEEAILLKNFRFFDLDNSGTVEFNEFVKAVEKIGVQTFDEDVLRDLYKFYDTDRDGTLDYREFSAILLSNASPATRKLSPEKSRNVGVDYIETVVDRVKGILAKRGPGGILGLGKQFMIADKNKNRELDRDEFYYAMRDFGTGLNDKEINDLHVYFDRDKSGTVNYDEFLYSIRGKMNSFRRALAEQAFEIIDKNHSGDLTIDDLKGVYNASQHPEVKAGKKTEDAVLLEFLKTFETMYDYNRIDDDKVTKDEFVEYYNFVSASIDNDQYFELMMNNAWRMNEGANKRWNDKGWGSEANQGGKSLQSAAGEKRGGAAGARDREPDAFGKSRSNVQEANKKGTFPTNTKDVDSGVRKIRDRLLNRGARGFVGLQRQFKIMDDDNDKGISYREFTKALKDYKIDLTDDESRAVFREFDADGSGVVSIDEFVRAVRGEMNDFRRDLCTQAFGILDKDRDGVLRVNDIKGVYSARNHPDVKSGKRSEDEVLGEFLETFEAHHNLRAGGRRDQNISLNEFIEYYNNVSANIDDDKYFEHMIVTAFKLYTADSRYSSYAPQGAQTKSNWSQDFKAGKMANYAPFGTNNEATDYSTQYNRPGTAQSRPTTAGLNEPPTYKTSYVPNQEAQKTNAPNQSNDYLFKIFRDKVAARGTRGILGLARLFKIIDDDNSKSLNLQEFAKVLKDLRLDFQAPEAKRLFDLFDRDRSGQIDYDEFLRGVRGPLSENRTNVIRAAFNKLDANKSGDITLEDVRGVYNAKNHPAVRAGKKTEDEILAEFLDTFEQHHALHTGDSRGRNNTVTFEEFTEYYANISCSIDDDRYFDQMIRTAWNLDNTQNQNRGAWKNDKY
jgi:Ca2+-binding EF-hand superfamily protein